MNRSVLLAALALLLMLPVASDAQRRDRDKGPTKEQRAQAQELYKDRIAAKERYLKAGKSFIEENSEFGAYLKGIDDEKGERPVELEREIILNPPITNVIDIGASVLAGQDAENLNRLYRLVYPLLGKVYIDSLPRIREFITLPIGIKRKIWLKVIEITRLIDPPTRKIVPIGPANPIEDCTSEIGYEVAGTDSEDSDRCDVTDYASLGIMGNLSFPLQDNITCIKRQGRRGTCVAHATAATVETLRSVENGKRKNLSEQDIYFEGEAETEGPASMFIDGLVSALALDHFDAANYQLQKESEWNYNRASSRNNPAAALHPTNVVTYYPNSCSAGYTGERCTDYASSGDHTFLFPGLALTSSRPSVPASGAEEIVNVIFLPIDPVLTWSISLPTVKMLLDADVPIYMAMSITDDFSSSTPGLGVDPNGYVLYTGATTRNGNTPGGHAMECVGFIPNADLPAGAPAATEEGYYVLKNSWGTSSGDCGFYYVDEAYIRNRGTLLAVLEI